MNYKPLLPAILFLSCTYVGQSQVIKPPLSKDRFITVNRELSITEMNGKTVIQLDARPGDGVAWIKSSFFNRGVIELDIKGKNLPQQSFVGFAFHRQNDSTYDVVYFRPFNFQSKDSLSKKHAVQYVFLPKNDWSFLRSRFPGRYENSLSELVDPDNWFHVKLVVEDQIKVYVNNSAIPSLVIQPLNDFSSGNIGFWVGNNSDGAFANLSVILRPSTSPPEK